jgi:hypothetical protein
MVIIELNKIEQRLCRFLAKARYASNRENKIKDRKIGPQSAEDTDLEGIAGELIFAKMTNTYPDLTIEPRKGGHDLLYKGYKIDVKTTKHSNGRLLAVIEKKPDDADIYFLFVGELPLYTCRGWAWAHDLLKEENITDLGHGPTYALDQDHLNLTKIK